MNSSACTFHSERPRKQLAYLWGKGAVVSTCLPYGVTAEAVGVPGDVQVSAVLGTEHARHDGHLCFGALVARIDLAPSRSPPRPVAPAALAPPVALGIPCDVAGLGGRHLERISGDLERISRRVELLAEAQGHVRFPLVRVIKGTAELGQVAQ
jgi:hypothetical protein